MGFNCRVSLGCLLLGVITFVAYGLYFGLVVLHTNKYKYNIAIADRGWWTRTNTKNTNTSDALPLIRNAVNAPKPKPKPKPTPIPIPKLKLITYSLYGTQDFYMFGALRNALLALERWPEWDLLFYVHSSVLTVQTALSEEAIAAIAKLVQLPNVRIVEVNDTGSGLFWRFRPFFDGTRDPTEIVISRDTDSELLMRDKRAVDEWLQSDKDVHLIRDHPSHSFAFLGGMVGVRNQAFVPFRSIFEYWYARSLGKYKYGGDQYCLKKVYYAMNVTDIYVHTNYPGLMFKGEIVHPLPTLNTSRVMAGRYAGRMWPVGFIGRQIISDAHAWDAINAKYGWNLTTSTSKASH